MYVFLGSGHALVLIVSKGYPCIWQSCVMFLRVEQVVIAIASIFLALLFGIFVCVMFYDQLEAIVRETSTIDQL